MIEKLCILALLLAIVACAGQQPTAATPAPSSMPTVRLKDQPTLQPISTRPTRTPIAAPTHAPPTATERPTTPVLTATAIPAATVTPASTQALAASPVAEHRYAFPVRSDGKIRYGKFHHDYPAADIFCPVGSTFVAVTYGVVDFVSREDRWDPKVNDGATRGGLAIAIIGDDGVRYYGSHLSEVADGIKPGLRVSVGQKLGLTGKSGDARVTDSHLHFGISHPTTPDDWAVRRGEISPYPYLQAWQRGENVTPKVTR
jgi:murein DD-endopeptidase MepM/ murein hydrolase activator NlpD